MSQTDGHRVCLRIRQTDSDPSESSLDKQIVKFHLTNLRNLKEKTSSRYNDELAFYNITNEGLVRAGSANVGPQVAPCNNIPLVKSMTLTIF